jgi:hypothetical protein
MYIRLKTQLFAYLLFVSQLALAAIPTTIQYQGFLTDDTGVPVDGTVDIISSLYLNAVGGDEEWSESHSSVTVNNGIFSIELGSNNPFPANFFDEPLYLGIKVGTDPYMTPRLKLTASPYAMSAENLVACVSGETNCSGTCADLSFDLSNCGSCGTICHSGTQQCIVGTCVCSAGLGNCDANAANGCETNVQTDNNNCGFCGVVCSGGTSCDSGLCCAAGETNCNSTCTDTSTNVSHCGACNNACNNTVCNAGICDTSSCNTGFSDCNLNPADGCEVNIDSDASHCGACNNSCNGSSVCTASVCSVTCDDSILNQDETDTDCGGATCTACAAGQNCFFGSDCLSGSCDAGTSTCNAATCSDGLLNQDETDVDCGGSICSGCSNGDACILNSDCVSNSCASNVCVPPA